MYSNRPHKDHTLISFKQRGKSQCVGCDKPFTLRHILLECVDFSNVRNKDYSVDTIKQLINDVLIDIYFYS